MFYADAARRLSHVFVRWLWSSTDTRLFQRCDMVTTSMVPYSLPEALQPRLSRLYTYWKGLRRGENDMPFWDDVRTDALPDLAGGIMLIDVFEKPVRFRFASIGEDVERKYGSDLHGRFSDEIEPRGPLLFLNSQCSAAVEGRRPTYYRHVPAVPQECSAEPFARVLLPLWGDGCVRMLIGAVVWD